MRMSNSRQLSRRTQSLLRRGEQAKVVAKATEHSMLLDGLDARLLLDAAPDSWIIVDQAGVIRAFNRQTPVLFAISADDLEGALVESLLPAVARQGHAKLRANYAAQPDPRAMGVGLDLHGQRSDGTTFRVDISLAPLEIDGKAFVIDAIRDTTAATKLRDELHVALRDVALTEDRERVARDLHDTVIQEVFAVGLPLQSLSSRAENTILQERLDQAIDDLDRVTRDIRGAIFGLTNHDHWGRGPRGEILRVAADDAKTLGFEPIVEFVGPIDDLDPSVGRQLIPTLREALSNVARHAKARRCDVTLIVDGSHAELRVLDDGHGPIARRPAGRGLANMQACAEALGGACDLAEAPIAGAVLHWRVPRERP